MNDQIDKLANDLAHQLLNSIQDRVEQQITETIERLIAEQINSADVVSAIKENFAEIFDAGNQHFPFSANSIPGTAVDITGLTAISGDLIKGGVIEGFASLGIDDRAGSCQVTILDAGTVFENKLYASELEVRGDTVIDGNVIINGKIDQNAPAYQTILSDIESRVSASYQSVFDKLQNESLDISKLTIGQRTVIEGSTLTSAITESQLRQVGILQDLQTSGETLLSASLYTSNGRVGINTMDPASTLSIWDEEVEISIGKLQKDTAQINTRNNSFVIGSNGKRNITITSDGQTAIPKLRLGNISMSSSPTPPNYDADRGTVVFNENPNLGGPLGWVSLGDARWANFGIID